MARRSSTPESCPVCGTSVPAGAKSCPECGADERSGWNEDDTRYDGLDLPDSAFADDETPPRRATGQTPSIFWWVVAVGLLLVIAALSIGF
jgi:hypothetical protein